METRSLRTFRIVLWTLVAVAAIGATAFWAFNADRLSRGGAAAIGPELGSGSFALVDQRKQPVTEAIFKGKPSLLFFGFTHCPDVCPTTMGEMQGWFATLGDEAKNLQAVFITVDPARDTPEILDGYVSWVSDKIIALSGPQAEIDKAVKSWGVSAQKVGDGDDYTMNHTASVIMVDAEGKFFGTIAYEEATDTAIAKIRRLLGA